MNAGRRARIVKVVATLGELHAEIEALANEEREAYDNMPESLQPSERGEAMDEAANALEEAASSVEEAGQNLEGLA